MRRASSTNIKGELLWLNQAKVFSADRKKQAKNASGPARNVRKRRFILIAKRAALLGGELITFGSAMRVRKKPTLTDPSLRERTTTGEDHCYFLKTAVVSSRLLLRLVQLLQNIGCFRMPLRHRFAQPHFTGLEIRLRTLACGE